MSWFEPTDPDTDPRPRILGARFGANPNSSSLGVDVTFLLFGGAAALAAAFALSALRRGRRGTVDLVGTKPPPARPADDESALDHGDSDSTQKQAP